MQGEPDPIRHDRLNTDFHRRIIALSRNEKLIDVYEQLNAHMKIARIHKRRTTWARRVAIEIKEHRQILRALRKRKGALLAEALSNHIERSKRVLTADLADDLDEAKKVGRMPTHMSNKLEGIIPILATPFHDDGSIDIESQDRVVDHLLEQGAHGLSAFGNAGEGYALLADERRELLQAIVKRVDGQVPVVVGIGATGTDVAATLCKEAEDLGADALMVLAAVLPEVQMGTVSSSSIKRSATRSASRSWCRMRRCSRRFRCRRRCWRGSPMCRT